MGHFEMVSLVAPLQRLRVLATGCVLEVPLHGLACQLAVVHGGQKRAQRGRTGKRKAASHSPFVGVLTSELTGAQKHVCVRFDQVASITVAEICVGPRCAIGKSPCEMLGRQPAYQQERRP